MKEGKVCARGSGREMRTYHPAVEFDVHEVGKGVGVEGYPMHPSPGRRNIFDFDKETLNHHEATKRKRARSDTNDEEWHDGGDQSNHRFSHRQRHEEVDYEEEEASFFVVELEAEIADGACRDGQQKNKGKSNK